MADYADYYYNGREGYMDGKDSKNVADNEDAVICEFFGIKITTKSPSLAKVLKADVNDILQLDVSEVKDFIKTGDKPADNVGDENVDTKWASISDEVSEINELLEDDKKS